MLNGPNLERTSMLIASIDPYRVMTRGTLPWHIFSTNVRMQLNLGHLPSSFIFLCSAAVGSEYTVLVISDQITETSELMAFLDHYWRFLKEIQTPSTRKRFLWRYNKAYVVGVEVGKAMGWIPSAAISLHRSPYFHCSSLTGEFVTPELSHKSQPSTIT